MSEFIGNIRKESECCTVFAKKDTEKTRRYDRKRKPRREREIERKLGLEAMKILFALHKENGKSMLTQV